MTSPQAPAGKLNDLQISVPASAQADDAAVLQQMVLASLWPGALALAVIYTLTAISHLLVLDPPYRLPLALAASLSAGFFFIFSVAARLRPPPLRSAHALAAMLALIVLANEALQQQLLLKSLHQQYTSIVLLASGALMLSTPWMVLCMSAAFAAWVLAIVRDPTGGEVIEWAYAHVTCALLGIAIHFVRKHTLGRLASVQRSQIIKNQQLETAISALRESESLFRHAERELIQSEQTNRAILQAIPDMIIRISRDGTIGAVQSPKNFEALWVTGQGVGHLIDQLLPAPLAQVARKHIAAALETSQVQTHEYEWGTAGGNYWREWRIAPSGSDEVIVIVRDITARKLAEDALLRSRQRLSELMADIDGIVWECEPRSFSFTFVSPRAVPILGYPLEDWLGDPTFFLRVLHPEDRDRIVGFCQDRTLRGLDHDMNYRVIAADGRVVWVHDKVRLVKDAQGKVIRLCGLLIDVTESMRISLALRENQVILDRAQEIASLGSWTWEKAGGRMTWSPQMYRISGITPAQFNGTWTRAFELIHPDDQLRLWQAADRAISSGHVARLECRLLRNETEERIVAIDGQLFYNDQGELDRVIGTVQDITDLRQAQAQRQRLEDELKQAQKLEAVGTLATGVAHDFNNLLNAINGYVDLARREISAETDAGNSLDMIQVATAQAASVTQSLLTFGRRRAGERMPVDVVENLGQSLRLLRNLLPTSIELVDDLPQNQPLFVDADAHQLQQIWLNLTINARDAMSAGGKMIIRLRRFSEGPSASADPRHSHVADSALITIKDHGGGMSEQVLQRIFEPYFTTKPRGQGTGLGLSIVHGIVTDHGGRITVQSEIGKGTTFSIHLPLCDPPAAPVATAPALVKANGSSRQSILLAERDEFIRAIITSSLQSTGYHVLIAEDGEEAVVMAQRHRDDLRLLLLDTELMRGDGDDFLRRIRLDLPLLPAILMSGGAARDAVSDSEIYLPKPFQIARLMQMVSGVLQQ